MTSQNAIIGEDYGIELTETEVDSNQLIEEKKAAKYSRSAEFKKIREHMEARIAYFQSHLPDGRPVATVPDSERVAAWVTANTIIAEFNAVINFYETANDIVNEANQRNQ